LYVDSNDSEKEAITIFTAEVRRFSCLSLYRQIARKVAITSMKVEAGKEHHLSQYIGMMNMNFDNQETK
jgi:hypothetical protein